MDEKRSFLAIDIYIIISAFPEMLEMCKNILAHCGGLDSAGQVMLAAVGRSDEVNNALLSCSTTEKPTGQ